MDLAADRPEFAPPPQPGMLRAFVLAVLAHLVLLVALTFGLHWQRESPDTVAEAELWSQVPQEAAPVPPPPAPTPPPAPPVVRAPPQPDLQAQRDAQIALEREREKQEADQRKLDEERKLAEQKKQQDLKRKQQLEAQRKLEEEQARKQEEARELAQAKKLEEDKQKKLKQLQEQKLAAATRQDAMRRMQALAAGAGSPDARGMAAKSSGPSNSWAGKVAARVKPNIVFTDVVSGNPEADVVVHLSPDGTIVGKSLSKSSGNKAWDEAVLRALDKTEHLPRDIDGRVPSVAELSFRPHD